MKDGFVRCGSAVPEIRVADCVFNADEMIKMIKEADKNDCSLLVFPELSVTGYTCGDLFLSDTLIDGAERELKRIVTETSDCDTVFIAGLPVSHNNKLYNCAAVCHRGEVLGLVPKTNIPSYGECSEGRYFTSPSGDMVFSDSFDCYMGSMIFTCDNMPEFSFCAEICEDLYVSSSPSDRLSSCGALITANLSASAEAAGRKEYRRKLADVQSSRNICGYILANCGFGESTQDLVFSGHSMIYENGSCLAETVPFGTSTIIYGDIDVKKLSYERRRINTFGSEHGNDICRAYFTISKKELALKRHFPLNPFIPEDKKELSERCADILSMQAAGLATRLKKIGCKTAVLGLSGGLDSTLALIVTVHAFDMLSLDRKGIIAVTMPCFGTTSRTKNNALSLAEAYGAQLMEINIAAAVRQHFSDIGHDESCHDVTYENSQARERTQVIMDIANRRNGIVVGTGDLSELALGWATYNGDHMSMYGVNADVPKTLIRHIVAYEADRLGGDLGDVLRDVLDTPVSPELLPPSEDGTIAQKTEDIVGPYELHDFFLYYLVRYGFSPAKIYRMALHTFEGIYDNDTVMKWLKTFVRRFFRQQFKRSCLPDGPKVGSVGLSPRGDWRMPSDASENMWTAELDAIENK